MTFATTCLHNWIIAGPIVNTQSVVVLVWIILGVSIKPGLCYDIPESLYGRTGIPYREHRTAVYRYIGISIPIYRYIVTPLIDKGTSTIKVQLSPFIIFVDTLVRHNK